MSFIVFRLKKEYVITFKLRISMFQFLSFCTIFNTEHEIIKIKRKIRSKKNLDYLKWRNFGANLIWRSKTFTSRASCRQD